MGKGKTKDKDFYTIGGPGSASSRAAVVVVAVMLAGLGG